MVNKIITGISQALDFEFNTGDTVYSIYSESIEQGFNEPCFSISNLIAVEYQLVGNRYDFNSSFDIEYHPSNTPVDGIVYNRCECNEVAMRLMNILRLISVDSNLIRGTKLKHEIVNDVLHFFVDYNMHLTEIVTKEETMGDITITQKLGG